MWYRVFGTSPVQPEAASLLAHIRRLEVGRDVVGKFSADDRGWFRAELQLAAAAAPLILDCYLAEEEGLRAELNTWAAWLETAEYNPHHAWLMQHMIWTTQLFTLRGPTAADGVLPTEYLCLELCRFLASVTDGVYQVDGHGFYSPDGSLLLEET